MAYALGIDYGTQSGRVILLDLASGEEIASHVVPYAHGVIDTTLPTTGENLPPDWALQHPMDYLDVLHEGIPKVIQASFVDPSQVIGLGIDFTSCTVLPVTKEGWPLCLAPEWQDRKHAWPKLWKHHAAQPIADRINNVARERRDSFLSRYGGRISSEWYYPKLIEVFEEDRAVYDACDAFIEATDWIVWYLTGKEVRNSCTAGYKAMWSDVEGVPDENFFLAVSPDFRDPSAKLGHTFFPLGTRAGYVSPEISSKLGLAKTVAVAVGNVDAMVSVPPVGVNKPGSLVMVMGTSICHLALSDNEVRLNGVTGVVKDGVLPGFYGYEAGQAAVGDMFEWFVDTQVPPSYHEEAKAKGVSIYEHLESLARDLLPGQNGLIALDWWNGNRSILGDADLSGILIGQTLATSVEEIYRALLESTAMGTRMIVDNFEANGIPIEDLVACGGLPQKSPLLMQIYADVNNRTVVVRASKEIPARGAAMFGAVAAGEEQGGFNSIAQASRALAAPVLTSYQPNPEAQRVYEDLYEIYREVYEFFGRDKVDLLHRLKQVRLHAAR